jgi:hypothetical protein
MQVRVSGAQHSHIHALLLQYSLPPPPQIHSLEVTSYITHHATVSLGFEARFDHRGDAQVCRLAFSTRRSTSRRARKDGGTSAS